MKGKIFCRFIAIAIALVVALAGETTQVNAKTADGSACTCPYCSLVLKKTGKLLREGSIVSKSSVKKVVKPTYKGKAFTNWSVLEKGNTVKYSKKGFKTTIRKGKTEKAVYLPVNRITEIYIKQSKLTGLTEGSPFPISSFKKKSIVMAEYSKGKNKKLSTYTVSAAKKVKANSNNEFIVTVKFGKHKDTIAFPVAPKQVVPKPSAQPTATPTDSPSAEPTVSPSTKPTVEPSTKPTAEPSTKPTAEPTAEPSTKPTAKPPIIIIVPTSQPTVSPSTKPTVEPSTKPTAEPTVEPSTKPTTEPTAEPSTKPTAEPTAEPSTKPTTEPTAEPSTKPTAEPTAEPTVEPEFFNLNIPNTEIIDCVDGEIRGNSASYGAYITIKPATLVNFSHWQDEQGNTISKQTVVSFYVKDNITYIPVYSNTPDSKPEVLLRFTGYKLLPDDLTVRLFMKTEIPEGFERTEWGYVYTNKDFDESTLIVGGDVYTVINEATTSKGSAEWTNNISFLPPTWETGTLVKFRTFVKIINPEGNEEIVYSSILEVNLSLPAD